MPASGNYVVSKGKTAAAAITKKRFVKLDTADNTGGTVEQCDAQGERAYGVAMFSVTTGEIAKGKGCTVQVEGRAVVELGVDTATIDDFVTTDASGRAMVATTGDFILGRFDELPSTVATGKECSVLLSIGSGAISAGS